MARKKRRIVRRRKPMVEKESVNPRKVISSRFKFGIVLRNLVLFTLLFVISYILYLVSESDVFVNLFYFLWIIFAFIAVAFFLALLVLLLMKIIRR